MDPKIPNATIASLLQQNSIAPISKSLPNIQSDSPIESDFSALLQEKLKVSNHASTRLQSRNISLGPDEWNRVIGGVEKAAAKGAKESLVMVGDVALVVSVKNRTVITAVDKDNLKQNVFTNIDSAVIV